MSQLEGRSEFTWPDQAIACVSLTYDDGDPDNLDHAIPDLENAGFRGTFYLYKTGPAADRIEEWKAAAARGHEMGNHTTSHPCRNDAKVRVKPLKNPLENYSPERIRDEIQSAADWLEEMTGPDPHRTFAYPCGATAIGLPADDGPYRNAISLQHDFARDLNPVVNQPAKFDPLRIGAFMFQKNLLSEFTDACDLALQSGGWVVLVFHSIDGSNHGTTRHVHQQLLAHLQSPRFWVAPVRDVTQYITRQMLSTRNVSPA